MIDYLVEYHKMRTNAPPIYAKHLAINLMGHSLGRKSVVHVAPRGVHFNMYTMVLGPSQKALKSTTQEDVIAPLIPAASRGPNQITPAGLLIGMDEDGSDIICPLGEFQYYLREIRNGGHMAHLKELCNDLINCPDIYTKRLTSQRYDIPTPYLSIMTSCAHLDFFDLLTEDMVFGGFLARFILPFEDVKRKPKRPILPDNVEVVEDMLRSLIYQLYLNARKTPLKFVPTEKANDMHDAIVDGWNDIESLQEIDNFISRYDSYLFAYAGIIKYSEMISTELNKLINLNKLNNLNTEQKKRVKREFRESRKVIELFNSAELDIEPNHIIQAEELLSPCLDFAKTICKFVGQDLPIQKMQKAIQKIDVGCEKPWGKVMTDSGLLKSKFQLAVDTLKDRGEITYYLKEFKDKRKNTVYIKRLM